MGANAEVCALAGPATKTIDLAGKTVLPGLIDAHSHFPGAGMDALYVVNLQSPPVGTVQTIEDLIAALKRRADETPKGQWVGGGGCDFRVETRHAVLDPPRYTGHANESPSGNLVSRQPADPEGKVLGPDQRIKPIDAIRAVTIDAAWQNFEQNVKGSIEIGKFADLTILAENPTTADPAKIKDIQVLETSSAARACTRRRPRVLRVLGDPTTLPVRGSRSA